jgi:hypothetical protein
MGLAAAAGHTPAVGARTRGLDISVKCQAAGCRCSRARRGCFWCPESAPMPRILGLHPLPPAAKAAASNL